MRCSVVLSDMLAKTVEKYIKVVSQSKEMQYHPVFVRFGSSGLFSDLYRLELRLLKDYLHISDRLRQFHDEAVEIVKTKSIELQYEYVLVLFSLF